MLLVLGNYGWNYLFQERQSLVDYGGVVFLLIAAIFSLTWLFRTFRRTEGKGKHFWLLLFIGNVNYVLGEAVYFAYLLVLRAEAPSPGWSELFWIMQYLFYFAALLLKMYQYKRTYKMVRLLFDSLIVMTAATTISWQFIIKPLTESAAFSGAPLLLAIYVGYPVLDLGLLFGLVSLFFASRHIFSGKTMLLLSVGFLSQVISDTVYLYETASNSYNVGSWVDPLWILALMFLGLAGISFHERKSKPAETLHLANQQHLLSIADFLRHSIPYISVFTLFVIMCVRMSERDSIAIGAGISILLVIIRQIVIIYENHNLLQRLQQLTEELERKVEQRTKELHAKNVQLEETLSKMDYMAYHDLLSGLPNRRLFEDRLSNALARAKRNKHSVGVIFLDLDRFKNINDSLGHAFGDIILKQVAERLSGYFSEADTISRQGGDEFAIILEGNKQPHQVAEAAQKILTGISKPFIVNGQELRITSSIGIAMYPNDGTEVDILMKRADAAMYRVKEKGKNNYQFFDLKLDDNSRLEWENALYKALERDEFRVFYQPRVSTVTGEIVGMEALIRWERPGHGLIPPGQFIPLAEETGLIVQIGEWVLHTACKQNKAWQENGLPPLRVAVNLSSKQFQQANLVSMIDRVLQETQLDPCYLELEITESLAMHDVESVIEKLKMLKAMGIAISMDDFGTGYSSLRYLGQFPIDVLKIDRSFIQEIDRNANHAAIVTAITAMGRSLQLQVLAEGVEEETQLSFLRKIGCQEMQGYLYSPPVPAAVFEQMLFNVSHV